VTGVQTCALPICPHQGTQDILNIQPVIPLHITEDWNIITRTILPLIWQPSLQPAHTVPFGTGPTSFSAFLSPSKPVTNLPTLYITLCSVTNVLVMEVSPDLVRPAL
jgi:hypothetical protein